MLLLMVGMLGVFVALDLFLFYVFWEVSLFPMYFVIGIWGGPRRIYATVKFVIYTLVGSLLMLVAILAVAIAYAAAGNDFTFSYEALRGFAYTDTLQAARLHRLLPGLRDQGADVAAPHLAARCARRGPDGRLDHPRRRPAQARRLRVPALQPAAPAGCGRRRFAPIIIGLAIVAILYGAMVAMVQPDMKKLVAYSSVSHMGFVMLGDVRLQRARACRAPSSR